MLQNGGCSSRNECFLYFELFDLNKKLLSSNALFLSPFHFVTKLKKPNINVSRLEFFIIDFFFFVIALF